MAGTFKVKHIERTTKSTLDEETKLWVESPGDHLLVTGDPFNNGGQVVSFAILLSDYDGLLEEWEGAEGGPLLAAAVTDFCATISGSDPTWAALGLGMTADQRVAYVAEEVPYL